MMHRDAPGPVGAGYTFSEASITPSLKCEETASLTKDFCYPEVRPYNPA